MRPNGLWVNDDGNDLRPQHFHAKNVRFLPFRVLFSHIDAALHTEQSRPRRRRDAVLSRAGFGDDPFFAHMARQQNLPHDVVDFMRARMTQIFAFQIDFRPADRFGQPPGEIQRRFATDVFL